MAGSTPASAIAEPGRELGRQPAGASLWAEAWRRFKRHKMAVASLIVLLMMVALSMLALRFTISHAAR